MEGYNKISDDILASYHILKNVLFHVWSNESKKMKKVEDKHNEQCQCGSIINQIIQDYCPIQQKPVKSNSAGPNCKSTTKTLVLLNTE